MGRKRLKPTAQDVGLKETLSHNEVRKCFTEVIDDETIYFRKTKHPKLSGFTKICLLKVFDPIDEITDFGVAKDLMDCYYKIIQELDSISCIIYFENIYQSERWEYTYNTIFGVIKYLYQLRPNAVDLYIDGYGYLVGFRLKANPFNPDDDEEEEVEEKKATKRIKAEKATKRLREE